MSGALTGAAVQFFPGAKHGVIGRMLFRAFLVLAVSMFVVGCGGKCEDRSGSYRSKMTRRSGTCSQSIETVVNANSALPAGCTGHWSPTADNCEVSGDMTCPDPSGASARTTGTEKWSADGKSGTGTFSMDIRSSSGAPTCQGIYDVTFTKI